MLKPLVLKLACVHPKNREWIMSQLTSTERGLIQYLLDEIRELGLDKDIATIQAVLVDHENAVKQESTGHVESVQNLNPFWQDIVRGKSDNPATTNTDVSRIAAPRQLSAALMSIAKSKSL